MKPAPFRYVRPESLEEAVEVLRQYGWEAKVLAGGQSLVPLLNMRLTGPSVLVDINRVRGLDQMTTADGWLEFGALVRQRRLEDDPVVVGGCPLLAEAARWIGHPATRNRGTVVGSIVHADPAGELPLLFVTLGGELVARGPDGTRTIPAEELYLTMLTTSLAPDELAVAVRFPVMPAGTLYAFEEFAHRHGDFALVAVAVALFPGADGRVAEARIGIGGAADVPFRARQAEEAFLSGGAVDEAVDAAAHLAAEQAQPPEDMHGSAEYRRQLVRVLTRRALYKALTGVRKGV